MKKILTLILCVATVSLVAQRQHPNLNLTQKGVQAIKAGLGQYPLLDRTIEMAKADVHQAIAEGITVPIPRDPGGGYTHERHKSNYTSMKRAGALWQIFGDEKYARFVRDMLLEYAKLYPSLETHPEGVHSSSPGRLFWQSLNDHVWLLHTIQAYDMIIGFLTPEERRIIENNLLHPAVRFSMAGRSFDRVHNHGTWAVSGVIMAGYVLGVEEYVQKGLLGSNLDGQTGFLRQIDQLFSPDGFYQEGAYYLRYAYWPFVQTALAVQNNQPELNIWATKDSVLVKAAANLLYMTDGRGRFLPFNNAIIEKNWTSHEIIPLVNVLYSLRPDPNFLYVVQQQGWVMLTEQGVNVARDAAAGKASKHFHRPSMFINDGPNGDRGGMGFLRHGTGWDQMSVIMKYTQLGMGHGHFDKLSMMIYDQNAVIFQDYGTSRYLNVPQKRGGRYLPETETWAKQTVAHNTVVVDQRSNYDGQLRVGNLHSSLAFYFNIDNPKQQVMSAFDTTAYPGVFMQRTMAMITNEDAWGPKPIVVDIFRLASPGSHTYDMVFNYPSTLSMIETDINYDWHKTWEPLGTRSGYQHLFNRAEGVAEGKTAYFTFFKPTGIRFYTLITTTVPDQTEIFFTQVGANDPEFSLRPDRSIILRNENVGNFTFATIIEPHGEYNEPFEFVRDAYSKFKSIETLKSDRDACIVLLTEKCGRQWVFATANNTPNKTARHDHTVGNQRFQWTGNFMFDSYTPQKFAVPTPARRR